MEFVEQLRILEAAQGDSARLALATVDLAHSGLTDAERTTLKGALQSAAIPHWVDESILANLIGESRENSTRYLARLRGLSVVEPFPARGEGAVNVHEATRKALRKMLREQQSDRFALVSKRARECLSDEAMFHERIERLYHLFAVDQDAAAIECERLDAEATHVAGPEAWRALATMLSELVDEKWLGGRALLQALLSVHEARISRSETAGVEEAGRTALNLAKQFNQLRSASRAHVLLGDFFVLRGQLESALVAFRESLELLQKLISEEPTNLAGQSNLGVTHSRIGDIFVQQGRIDEALASFREYLTIAQRLAAQDPTNVGWQRELGVAYSRIGDIFVQQDRLDEALASFREYLTIAQRLAAQDPANANWQSDLGIAHAKIGDIFVQQGRLDEALASFREYLIIAQRLAAQDPTNADWQRGLGVGRSRIGGIFVQQGRLDEALASFREYLTIAQRLAAQDPANANWQSDLGIAHAKIGDIFVQQGRLDEALASFREYLTIAQRLAAQDLTNADWQRGLGVAQSRVGRVLAALGDRQEALPVLRGAERQVRQAIAMAPAVTQWTEDLANIRDLLRNNIIDEAKNVLTKREGSALGLFNLGKDLKNEQRFNLARRMFALAAKQQADVALHRKIVQQHASSTEKDPDLPLDRRYQRALEIIAPVLAEAEEYLQQQADKGIEQREEIINAHQETFGIAGAIHKRWWQVDTQVRHLVKAEELYEKGWRLAQGRSGPGIPDQGYTGINAAFVLDLLAQQVPDDLELVAQRKQKAQEIRSEIRTRLTALPENKRNDWWTLVTLAEACFGLRDYDGARHWLKAAADITPPQRWEYETTVKQLARLAMIQAGGDKAVEEFATSDAWSVLSEFVGGDQAGLLTAFSGKVGLALSGGGFRASLFHIGVLARLAELDMLRHVEVLSCVSGGSIIGALYYLKVRGMLESKPDNEITREDYLKLVHDMDEQFTAMIQHNPRMQVFSKVAQLGQRTEEMAKLLDTELYGPAAGLKQGDRPELRSLRICPPLTRNELSLPREERSPFVPKYDNWQRAHKVPILIINATTLNTGHNWQFTATFMGESPNQIVPEVDANERLRRMYFDEKMPEQHRKLPLGLAVAASAGVPGLFRPVQLADLYKEQREIQLVDGGVHDNQGIGGLLEQDCTVMFISDASGQFVTEREPSRLETSVLMRSNSTLMARVRELD